MRHLAYRHPRRSLIIAVLLGYVAAWAVGIAFGKAVQLTGTWSTGANWQGAFPSRPGDLLNLRDLEQGLEQMKRVPSQEVEMEIVPGAFTGESDVVIHTKRGKRWRVVATVVDSGARGTGKLQAGLSVALDDALGLND